MMSLSYLSSISVRFGWLQCLCRGLGNAGERQIDWCGGETLATLPAGHAETGTLFADRNLAPMPIPTLSEMNIMKIESLHDVLLHELTDLYSAETQLLKALPKIAKAATFEELRSGFEEHLEQTEGQVERLNRIFESLEKQPKRKKCVGMEGLIEEGKDLIEMDAEPEALDAALICAAKRSNITKWQPMAAPKRGRRSWD
jgi:hypothetical protein